VEAIRADVVVGRKRFANLMHFTIGRDEVPAVLLHILYAVYLLDILFSPVVLSSRQSLHSPRFHPGHHVSREQTFPFHSGLKRNQHSRSNILNRLTVFSNKYTSVLTITKVWTKNVSKINLKECWILLFEVKLFYRACWIRLQVGKDVEKI
jgi:hypothetical protein